MQRRYPLAAFAALILNLFIVTQVMAAPDSQPTSPAEWWLMLAASLAWLVPAGFTLMAAAAVPAERAWQVALAGVAGAGLAILAFFLVGFALAFGGVGLVHGQGDFAGLIWEWSLLGPKWGPDWGMVGLAGWGLAGSAATPGVYALFFAQLPWVATATLIPLLALRGRTPALVTLLAGLLVGGLLYPLAANWIWGGGWLANLGHTLNLGHGLVDFAGGGLVHLLGGVVALAGLLILVPRRPRRESPADEPAALPAVHLPLLAGVGALLVLAGSLGWSWANPLLQPDTLMLARSAVNGVLAAAGGALLPLAYLWFVTGRHDSLMMARGLAAGAVAGAASGPLMPPWAALVLGLGAGLLVVLITYAVSELLRLADDTGVVAVHITASLLGLLSIGLLADGMVGAGWNGVGGDAYLGVAQQGVTGLLAASRFQPDWPGQMQAQLVGAVTLFLVPLLATSVVFGPVAVLAWGLSRRSNSKQPFLAGAVPHAGCGTTAHENRAGSVGRPARTEIARAVTEGSNDELSLVAMVASAEREGGAG